MKKINSIHTGNLNPAELGEEVFNTLIKTFIVFVEDILGLKEEKPKGVNQMMDILLEVYSKAKESKDYDQVDKIQSRFEINGLGSKRYENWSCVGL